MRIGLFMAALTVLAGCELGPVMAPQTAPSPIAAPPADVAAQSFVRVVEKMEPVAEGLCRTRLPRANCDFQIVVDTRRNQPPNAFQTVDKAGRPIIGFTVALIGEARNEDELAFVLGHEAAHHIAGHLEKTRDTAVAGALLGGLLATIAGADQAAIGTAQDLGASVGARTFSKDFELEADRLGTLISYRAGYDPVRGSAFFTRIPDPGDRFLGTHPPNAARQQTVRDTMRTLR